MTKNGYIRIYLIMALIVTFIAISIKYQFLSGIKLFGDSVFHIQRILEIRMAFKQGTLPCWLNFNTFYGIGQAVNGMYPDLTLWPFVAITNFMSPQYQMATINFLIFFLTLLISFLSIKSQGNGTELSFYISVAYTFSGYCLYQYVEEFQPGVAIINIFAFPILFITWDLLNSTKIDVALVCKFSLCMILIAFSHLLSLVVYGYLLLSVLIIRTVFRKLRIGVFLNTLLSIPLILLGSSPILYRILTLTNSNILMPYGKGHIKAATFQEVFNTTTWWSRGQLSIMALIMLIIAIAFCNKQLRRKLVPLLCLELYIFVLCLSIFPWKLFDHIPLINNLQYTPWRFGVWLAVIPSIMMVTIFKKYDQTIGIKIGFTLAILSVLLSNSSLIYLMSGNVLHFNNKASSAIVNNNTIASPYKTAILYMGEHPDYFPDAKNVKNDKYQLTASRQKQLYNQKLIVNNSAINFVKEPSTHGVTFTTNNVKNNSADIVLPLICYQRLSYDVSMNGKLVHYSNNAYGNMVIKNAKLSNGSQTIAVQFNTPKIYKVLLALSMISILLMLIEIVITGQSIGMLALKGGERLNL